MAPDARLANEQHFFEESYELNITVPEWVHLEQLGVSERHATGRCLAATETDARYECVTEGVLDPTRHIWLVDLDQPGASEHLLYWQTAVTLEHAHLIRLFEAASIEYLGKRMGFCVLEAPDENLEAGLEERALEPQEALQILESAADALAYLHAHDSVHTRVEPLNIVAVGEQIKLSAHAISAPAASLLRDVFGSPYEAPEIGSSGYSSASDMWAFGAVLFRALTQEYLPENAFFRISALPAPFSTVLLRCLEQDPLQRWSAQDVLREISYSQASLTPAQIRRMPEAAAVALPVVPVAPLPAMTSPVKATVPTVYERRRPEIDESAARPWARYAIVGSVVLIGLLWLLFRKGPERSQVPPAHVGQDSNGSSIPATAAPSTARPVPSAKPRAQAPPPTSSSAVNWRVVAYTFNRIGDAAHKAEMVNTKTPGLHAEVFSTDHGRPPFLVCLGGWMTNEQAKLLRRKAISSGLPHDTYAQNFRR